MFCLPASPHLPITPCYPDHELSSRRRKCDTNRGETKCVYCLTRDIPCKRKPLSFLNTNHQDDASPVPSPTYIQPKVVELPLPDSDLCLELVGLYFDLIHDQFHSIFHRPSFMEDLLRGVAPKVILFAMMALSARFVKLSLLLLLQKAKLQHILYP